MSTIRPFRNADLPALANVWVSHWSLVASPPSVSTAMIEQAILARTFFDASMLLVAEDENKVTAWCHFVPHPEEDSPAGGTTVDLCAICIAGDTRSGQHDELLGAVESQVEAIGCNEIRVGPVRDSNCGYAGLPPIGHGIGVPSQDERITSLLSRSGYTAQQQVVRMVATTRPYRVPVNREVLQLRRTTNIRQQTVFASRPRRASAMSHLDIERNRLVRHHSNEELASVDFWYSDPEAQVMSSSVSIVDLAGIHDSGLMSPEESYLVATTIQSLAERRILSVETAVDRHNTTLIDQLTSLKFETRDSGNCWTKSLR